jgi:hypothetical protein
MRPSAWPAPLTTFEDFVLGVEHASCVGCGGDIFRHRGARTWAHRDTNSVWCERTEEA